MTSGARDNDGVLKLCRWSAGYALRRPWGLAAVLGATLAKVGLDVLAPWPGKILIDHVLSKQPIPETLRHGLSYVPGAGTPSGLLAWCIGASVLFFLAGWCVGLAGTLAAISLGQRMVYDLAGDLFAHLQRLSLRFHARRSVGDLLRRVTADTGCVSTVAKDAMLPVVTSLVALCAMFAVMWRVDPPMTLLALSVMPLMVFAFRRYAGPMLNTSYAQHDAEGRVYEHVERTLSNVRVVQAFCREEDADQRLRAGNAAVLSAALASTDVQLKFKTMMGLATAIGTAAIIWVGGRRALSGAVTVGEIVVFLSYLGSLYAPLHALMYTSSTVQGAAGSARRVWEVLEGDREVDDRPGASALPPIRGHVRFESVTFGYDAERAVLREVSFEARPGEVVAIVGPTGAGKSTLVSLIPRFFDPWSGRVTIDGQDLRDVQLRSLRTQVALVLQEPFLFPMTIADNIAYGRPDAPREAIEAAAGAANVASFARHLPDGYDTPVGERGATLSGGERQRLSIARALLKDAPVLILDEPTSALDAETERMLVSAIDRLTAGRTTLVIAHRLSTIRNADRIVVLNEGRVEETGTHDELIKLRGLYAKFYAIQFDDGIVSSTDEGGRRA